MERVTTGTVSVGREEINNVVDALKKEMLSTGEYMHKLEETFPGFYGKDFGVMVNSGQSALEVALEYVVSDGKYKIAVPALTYMATIWAACNLRIDRTLGTELHFFDIKLEDYGIDIDQPGFSEYGDSVVSKDSEIIVSVDLFGKPCKLGKTHGQVIIEDACESVGNHHCSYGDFICFSFYSSHIMSVGTGGMVVFNDKEADSFIRSFIAHGREYGGDFTKHTGRFIDRFTFSRYGRSLRADNINAAIALAQYKKVLDLIRARRDNAARMNENLKELSKIAALPSLENNVFQFYPLLVHGSDYNVLHLMEFLYDNKVDSRRFMPVLTQPAFKKEFSLVEPDMFPNSLLCGEKGILLGCHQNLTRDQIDYMCEQTLGFFRLRGDI